MKTMTYLRISLLIPIILWGLCILFFISLGASPLADVAFDRSTNIATVLAGLLALYALGIIFWIIPYILLSLSLFFWSFRSQARTALKVFALSPLAMAVLTIATLNVLVLINSADSAILSDQPMIDQSYIGLNIFGAALTLIWGYICVGIGFGIYKLLQRREIIQDEGIVNTVLQPAS